MQFLTPRFLIAVFAIFLLALFLYSFTQIDLSLTLSRASIWQDIQKSFQYVGYFNRPLSTYLFLFILGGLFTSYVLTLRFINSKRLTQKALWVLIGLVVLFLTLSYNAFSYDLFNYIFDAKIFTFYQKNPYQFKPLDFPTDPMLSFMRWTHRVYPYGPVWLGITIPLSYLGLHYFAVTLVLFKLLMAASFVGTVFFIYKILLKIFPKYALLGTAFFALNPLVFIESLVSSHNDIVMFFLAMVAVYFLVQKRLILAFVFLALSIGIKFATVFLLPVFLFVALQQLREREVQWEQIIIAMIGLMAVALIAASQRSTFQPWYLLYVLPFASLLAHKKYIFYPFIVLSVAALLNYVPFLYTGNWDPPTPAILLALNLGAVAIACLGGVYFYVRTKSK